MEQSPSWEADSHLASQKIPHLLWNPKVHYRVHNSPSMVPILSQMHPVHTFPPYFPKICYIIILPSMPRSFKWSVPSSHQKWKINLTQGTDVTTGLSPLLACCSALLPLLGAHITVFKMPGAWQISYQNVQLFVCGGGGRQGQKQQDVQ